MKRQYFGTALTVFVLAAVFAWGVSLLPDPATAQLTSPTVRAQIVPFSVERDNITTASVNLAFGFTASTVAIEANATNTAVIAIDWVGGTAVCPAINTAGDARFPIGRIIMKDRADIASISVIACSGTQSVNVTAWQ